MGRSGSFAVTLAELDIAKLLLCGQSFRWRVEGDEHLGVVGGWLWALRQTSSHLHYRVLLPGSVDDDNIESRLKAYFQLQISLPALYARWGEKDPKFTALLKGGEWGGIRILGQDPVETIFAFICSSNNNITRISNMVEKLATLYGEEIGVWDGKKYYAFPTVDKLIGKGTETTLRGEGFGYRAGYIASAAEQIVQLGGVQWVEGLKGKSYQEARTELQGQLKGVGRKVADCICLMSLNFPEAIPVDTHIHQVAKTYLPHLAKVKTLTDKVYGEITAYFYGLYGEYAGWAQSVLFASTVRHLQADKNDKDGSSSKKKKLGTGPSNDEGSDQIQKNKRNRQT